MIEYVKERVGIRWKFNKKIFGLDGIEIVLFPPSGSSWYHYLGIPYITQS